MVVCVCVDFQILRAVHRELIPLDKEDISDIAEEFRGQITLLCCCVAENSFAVHICMTSYICIAAGVMFLERKHEPCRALPNTLSVPLTSLHQAHTQGQY